MKILMESDRMRIACRKILVSGLFIGMLAGVLAGQTSAPGKTDNQETGPLYVIQPNDILEIFVWKEPELTRKVFVRPDGRISFPLIQDLLAAGMTPGELKQQIEQRLDEFLNAPEATVIVDSIQSYKIYVLGKVQRPGGINVEKPVTVLQALALAGGFQDFAKDEEITIIRTQGKNHTVFTFNYREVIKGRRTEQNIVLKSDDVVVIP